MMMIEINADQRPDLYIALVCAAGTDLNEVKAQLHAQLSIVGYRHQEIKISKLIGEFLSLDGFDNEYERMKAFMAGGDKIRRNSENHSGVAALAVTQLRVLRGVGTDAPTSTAYIIDSLKNPAEVQLFDTIYGRNYYTISVYCPREERIENLKNKIAKDLHEPPSDFHENQAKDLIIEDEKGTGRSDQNVQDTFPLADYFINGKEEISTQVARFVKLVFGEPFTTPTPDEYFMFLAKATALRSCDLSRQVGAIISSKDGSILASGCNEVPLQGGGFFNESLNKSLDNRDYVSQLDPNYIEIQRSLIEFIGLLRKTEFISVSSSDTDSAIVDKLLHGEFKEIMSNARVRNLIEFGRVVHAEMHALSQAAADGRSVKGATLYCTTFPCHGCARHIIAAGIDEVIYIEPYPKSLTLQLYDNEIEVIHSTNGNNDPESKRSKVTFRAFHGISPTLYQRVFRYRTRKDTMGTIVKWNPRVATPVGAAFGVERSNTEIAVSQGIVKILESVQKECRSD